MNEHTKLEQAPRPLPGLPPGKPGLGAVHLAVTDRDRALSFYRDVLGLEPVDPTEHTLRMAAGGRVLVVLHPGALGPVTSRCTGLYHFAIHVQTDEEFARVLARLFALRWPHSPTDHTMSKATYLSDPDGNGVEVTLETPERLGRLIVTDEDYVVIDSAGVRRSGRDPVDLDEAFAHLPAEPDLGRPMPAGTTVGHIHLHVNDLDATMRFYSEGLGLDAWAFARGLGMADTTVDGWLPHLVAFNVWNGVQAPRPPRGTAGLRWYTFALPTPADREAAATRLEAQGVHVERSADRMRVHDPSGNAIALTIRRGRDAPEAT